MTRRATALSWSSGKDAAWALHVLGQDPGIEVRVLLTTFNDTHDRAAMHGVRRDVVRAQARAAGLPLVEVALPWPCPNEIYEARMREALETLRDEHGIAQLAFGDLFLEDVRAYRVRQLEGSGIEPLFPLWGEPTGALARRMMGAGLAARLVCVDTRVLDRAFAGRAFDHTLLDDLPAGIDACGEHGEFHTLVVDGPVFEAPLEVRPGPVVEREGYAFADFTLVTDTERTACVS